MLWVYAESIGPEAVFLRGLRSAEGRVIAVVRDGVYLESLEGYVVCLVGEEGVDGPLSARVKDFGVLRTRLEGRVGREVMFGRDSIEIGGEIGVGWKHAREWKGLLPSKVGSVEERVAATRSLNAVLQRDRPALTMTGIMSSLSDSLDDLTWAVRRRGNAEQVSAVWGGMLGFGEGLTPLGDDLAMGVLAGMVWLAEVGVLERGWVDGVVGRVREVAGKATNRISERLLWWAGEGVLYGAGMELGEVLFAGRVGEVEEVARRLLGVGHSTGWGMAMGIGSIADFGV